MRRAALLTMPLLTLLLTMALPPLGAKAESEEKPQAHTDAQLREYQVFDKFKAGWSRRDVEERMDALRALGGWRHKKVLKRLKRIWLKETDVEILAVAAAGLGNQTPFKRDAGKALIAGLEKRKKMASREDPEGKEEVEQRLESQMLVAAIHGVGSLGYRDGWDEFKAFIDHHDDDVAGEMMLVCGHMKEYRALPLIFEWFNFYPDGHSWSGGSVSVDTGTAGGADARAAKAKWRSKYGSRKRKARPNAWEKMVQAVEMITGEKMEKPAELKEWMKENKVLLRKHGA